MIISVEKKFIFVANLKAASTSIESALRPHGDIVVRRSELGKHLSFSGIENRFKWLFDVIGKNDFFKFGVIRDPLDYSVSLFKSHRDKKFLEIPDLYAGDMNFDDFLETWVPKNRGQFQPQTIRFKDRSGSFALDYLVLYENLSTEFPRVMNKIGISDIKLPRMNVSPTDNVDISGDAKKYIEKFFSSDYEAIEIFCNKQ